MKWMVVCGVLWGFAGLATIYKGVVESDWTLASLGCTQIVVGLLVMGMRPEKR